MWFHLPWNLPCIRMYNFLAYWYNWHSLHRMLMKDIRLYLDWIKKGGKACISNTSICITVIINVQCYLKCFHFWSANINGLFDFTYNQISSYGFQSNRPCESSSTILQNGHILSSNFNSSHLPVPSLKGATLHLNLLKAVPCCVTTFH